jgi:hypothetical protein
VKDYLNVQLTNQDCKTLTLSEPAGTLLSVCGIECLDQPLRGGRKAGDCEQDTGAPCQICARTDCSHVERLAPADYSGRTPPVSSPIRHAFADPAVIREAATAGFQVHFDASEYLQSGSERVPAITFVAGEPNTLDLSALSDWI